MSSSTLFIRCLNKLSTASDLSTKLFQYQTKIGVKSFCEKVMLKQMRTSAITNCMTSSKQEKINVFSLKINIEKVGTGPHTVLCLPGALGFIESDFAPQLEKLNHDKFTIIAWDPPGYGKSRPPNRDLVTDLRQTLSNDARFAHELMKKLGYNKFSILGWSDGAVTGLFMASLFPEAVQKMVIWGGQAFLNEKDRECCIKVRDIDSWSEKMKQPMIQMYGEQYFRNICTGWMDGYIKLHAKGGDLCKDKLSLINCPTFIIHGAKDAMVDTEHGEYLHKHIKSSKFFIMPEGKHNLHLRYVDEFNVMAETFLLSEETEAK